MSNTKPHPLIRRFESLANENSPDRGKLAQLRRSIQSPVDAYPIILPVLSNDISNYELNLYAMLAGLFGLYPKMGSGRNFGEHMRLAGGEDNSATERRFVNLLRTNSEDLPDMLRQAVSFLRSKDVPVNWEELRKDLLVWNHEDSYVQKKWARSFWGAAAPENTNFIQPLETK